MRPREGTERVTGRRPPPVEGAPPLSLRRWPPRSGRSREPRAAYVGGLTQARGMTYDVLFYYLRHNVLPIARYLLPVTFCLALPTCHLLLITY